MPSTDWAERYPRKSVSGTSNMKIKPSNLKNMAATAPTEMTAVWKTMLWSLIEEQTSEFGADERIEKRERGTMRPHNDPAPTEEELEISAVMEKHLYRAVPWLCSGKAP